MIRSIDPTTGEEIASFEPDGVAAIDQALDRAIAAQGAWEEVSVAQRAKLLTSAAKVLRERIEEFAALITREMGKPIAEAEAEVEKCAFTASFYAENAEAFLADKPVVSGATESYVAYDPLGVVLALMPWNFPFFQVFRFSVPAIVSGNAVVLKHAENVPLCARAVEAVWREAGAPAGLFQTLLIGPEPVEALIRDPRVAAVTFTGSSRVGAIIGACAGSAIKKTVLELGGSDPFIVLADSDIDAAVETAVRGRNLNAGQSCISAKRLIVEAPALDRFTEAYVERIRRLVVGNPTERATQMGPMARADLRHSIDRQVQATRAEGARVLAGGTPDNGPGFFYPPTALAGVTADMTAFREETFGPAAAIIRVADADEAITLANRSEYGLGCAIWTGDVDRARRLARRVQSGSVFVNGMVASDPRLPFGGVKRSGYGRELGVHGMQEFTNIRTIWIGPSRAPAALQLSE